MTGRSDDGRPRPRSGRLLRSADPVHLRADRRGVGADVHLRRRRPGLEEAALRRRRSPARPLPHWVHDGLRRPGHALDGRAARGCCSRPGWRSPRCSARRTATTPLPGVFYVLLWVGLVALSLAIGPVWRLLSPVRTVYRLLPLSRRAPPLSYPDSWGYWPAAVGLFRVDAELAPGLRDVDFVPQRRFGSVRRWCSRRSQRSRRS